MPKLIQYIEGNIYAPDESEVKCVFPIEAHFGEGDYIKVFKYVIFQQDYSRVEDEIEIIPTPKVFGIVSNNKRRITTLEISY